ncbi:MAG TPA: glycosyltransferase family A protein, partial [Chloroflexota bacterium]|nr:glycosyltransferase family A protein [Chloroflexota bacterium]
MTGSPVDAKISVIVPAYNHERFIVRTLESLTLQTRPADEIIVVNDGSPDDTETAVAPFLNDIDYIRQPNRGVAAALNRGLERATGDYFLFLASDDYLAPHALEVLATTLDG